VSAGAGPVSFTGWIVACVAAARFVSRLARLIETAHGLRPA
jgi:hypothetical protein